MTSAGIETPAGTVKPSGIQYTDLGNGALCGDRWTSDLPRTRRQGFAAGKQWFRTPFSTATTNATRRCRRSRWGRQLHYANGVVHVLRATRNGTATATAVTVQIFNDGVLTINGVVGSSVQIGSFTLISPDSSTLPAGGTATAKQYVPDLVSRREWPLYAVSGSHRRRIGVNPVADQSKPERSAKSFLFAITSALTLNGVSFSYPKIAAGTTVDDALACSDFAKWQIDKATRRGDIRTSTGSLLSRLRSPGTSGIPLFFGRIHRSGV